MTPTRQLAAALLAIGALTAPAAAQAQPLDMHASTATALAQARDTQDLRSPDARDAANGYSPTSPTSEPVVQDLRSPDTRDAAIGYAPEPVPEPLVTGGSSDGFDWVSGAIGAACVGGLILLLLGFMGPRRGAGRRHALHT